MRLDIIGVIDTVETAMRLDIIGIICTIFYFSPFPNTYIVHF